MKLNALNESNGPEDHDELDALLSSYDDEQSSEPKDEPEPEPEPPPREIDTSNHVCPIRYRKPSDEDWFRRNRKKCAACDTEYEKELDAAFLDDLEDEAEEEVEHTLGSTMAPEPGMSTHEWIQSLAARDPRKHHVAGEFGTGSPQAIQPTDEPIPALLKFARDYNIPVDPITGEAKRADVKAMCGYGHTCHSSPGKHPAWQYPMPDPLRTEPSKPGSKRKSTFRFNHAFQYDPTDRRIWPVSGLNGFKPKPEFEQYVTSKLSCPVCNGDEPGCNNTVSHQYGVPKPFCDEHLGESEYIRNLIRRLETEPGLNPKGREPDDAARVNEWEREAELMNMEPGARVYRGSTKANKKVGTVVSVDLNNAPRTHEIEWDDIPAHTYEDPSKLKLYGPHSGVWE